MARAAEVAEPQQLTRVCPNSIEKHQTMPATVHRRLLPHGVMRFSGLVAKRWPVVGGVLVFAALGGLLWWAPWGSREPVYEDRPVSYWISHPRSILAEPPPSLQNDSNAVPYLVEALKRDSWIGAAVYRKQVWPRLPKGMQQHLPTPANRAGVRETAAAYLRKMGPLAEPAIPALIRALKEDEEPHVRMNAVAALGTIGKASGIVIKALTETWLGTNRNMGEQAHRALSQLGRGAQLAAYIQGSKEGRPEQRIVAATALGRIGEGSGAAVAALTAALKDEDWHVRQCAAIALGQTAGENSIAAAAVTEALRDTNRVVRIEATNALLRLDPEAAAKAGIKPPSP